MKTLTQLIVTSLRQSHLEADGIPSPLIARFRELLTADGIPVEQVDSVVLILSEVLNEGFPELLAPAAEILEVATPAWDSIAEDIKTFFDDLYPQDVMMSSAKQEYVEAMISTIPAGDGMVAALEEALLLDLTNAVDYALSDMERAGVLQIVEASGAMAVAPVAAPVPEQDATKLTARILERAKGLLRRSRVGTAFLAQLSRSDWVFIDKAALNAVVEDLIHRDYVGEEDFDHYGEQLSKAVKGIKIKRIEELGRGECFVPDDFIKTIARNTIINTIEGNRGIAEIAFLNAIAPMMNKTMRVYKMAQWEYQNGKVRDISTKEPGPWKKPTVLSGVAGISLEGELAGLWVVFDAEVLSDAVEDALSTSLAEYNAAIQDAGEGAEIADGETEKAATQMVSAIPTKKVKQLGSEVCAQLSVIRASAAGIWDQNAAIAPLKEYGGQDALDAMIGDFLSDAIATSQALASEAGFTYNLETGEFTNADGTVAAAELLRAFQFLTKSPTYLSEFRLNLRKDAALHALWNSVMPKWNTTIQDGHVEQVFLALDAGLVQTYDALAEHKGLVTYKEFLEHLNATVAQITQIPAHQRAKVAATLVAHL